MQAMLTDAEFRKLVQFAKGMLKKMKPIAEKNDVKKWKELMRIIEIAMK